MLGLRFLYLETFQTFFSHQDYLGIFSMFSSLTLYLWLEEQQSPWWRSDEYWNFSSELYIVFFYLKLLGSSQARQSNIVLLVIKLKAAKHYQCLKACLTVSSVRVVSPVKIIFMIHLVSRSFFRNNSLIYCGYYLYKQPLLDWTQKLVRISGGSAQHWTGREHQPNPSNRTK